MKDESETFEVGGKKVSELEVRMPRGVIFDSGRTGIVACSSSVHVRGFAQQESAAQASKLSGEVGVCNAVLLLGNVVRSCCAADGFPRGPLR